MNENLPIGGSSDNMDEDVSPNLTALRVLAQLVSAIEQMTMVATLSFDRNDVVRQWNRTSSALYGIPIREALGIPLADLIFMGDKKEEFGAAVAQIWESGQPASPRDWQISTKSGTELWNYLTMFPVFYENKADQIFFMGVDITDRKRKEQVLFSSGASFRAMFENSPDAIMIIKDNLFLDVNPAALVLFCYTEKAEIVGRGAVDFSPPMQPDGQPSETKMQEMCELAKQNGSHRFEWMYVNCAQKPFWTETLLTFMQVEGEPLMYAVVHDITARKVAEQTLYLAAQVFENSREGIMVTDQDQRIISVNRAFTKITGYAPQDVLGQTPHMLSSGLHNQSFYRDMWKAIEQEDHWEGEILDRRRNNEPVTLWQSITVVRDPNRRISNYFSIFSDFTERKRTQEALRQSEERFRGAFETAVIGMALVGLDGQWLKVNPSVCRMFGYSEDELRSRTFQDITHPADLEANLDYVRQILAGDLDYFRMEKRYFHKDGHVVWALLNVSLVRDAQGKPIHFVSQIIDITQSKEAESNTRYLAEHDLLTGLPTRALLWGGSDRRSLLPDAMEAN